MIEVASVAVYVLPLTLNLVAEGQKVVYSDTTVVYSVTDLLTDDSDDVLLSSELVSEFLSAPVRVVAAAATLVGCVITLEVKGISIEISLLLGWELWLDDLNCFPVVDNPDGILAPLEVALELLSANL